MQSELSPPIAMAHQTEATTTVTQPQEQHQPQQHHIPIQPKRPSPTLIPGKSLEKSKEIEDLTKPKEKKKGKDIDKQAVDAAGEGEENDSFHRLYNKEIKVN